MSMSSLNRRVDAIEDRQPARCKTCAGWPDSPLRFTGLAPAWATMHGPNPDGWPDGDMCPTCGRTPVRVHIVHIGARSDGPQ